MDKAVIQAYVNNFRRRITPLLKPGIGLKCEIYPTLDGTTVLVFWPGTNVENDDVHKKPQPTGEIFAGLKQRAFGGDLSGIRFGGTNTILEPDKIILIKDSSPSSWTDLSAQKDVDRIIKRPRP